MYRTKDVGVFQERDDETRVYPCHFILNMIILKFETAEHTKRDETRGGPEMRRKSVINQ